MMPYLEYPLSPRGFINRFLVSGVYTRPSSYRKAVLQGRVNEFLTKGFDVYDHPGRKEIAQSLRTTPPDFVNILSMLPGHDMTLLGQTRKTAVYFPFDSEGLYHAAFYDTPTILRLYAGCVIKAPRAERAEFEIAVSGGLTLFLNGELLLEFKPFLRNESSKTQITLPLSEGENQLVCCLEDVAERDTCMRLELRYTGAQAFKQCVPVAQSEDTALVLALEKALADMFFPKDAYLEEKVTLRLESSLSVPVEMRIQPDRAIAPIETQLLPGQKEVALFDARSVPSGFYCFLVTLKAKDLSISKRIGVYVHDGKWRCPPGGTYAERKQVVRNIIKSAENNQDYRALILMEEGQDPLQFEQVFLNHLGWVEEMRDCSDFRMILLVYLYVRYAPRLSVPFRERLESAILRYRYWIDEPGDDVMWFFSENHALMFHTCQYLAGRALPDHTFAASGLTGREAAKKAEALLKKWFQAFFDDFITEWNSSTYIPIDVMALGYLHLLTDARESLHRDARRALDLICRSTALYAHRGTIMASFGRTYEKELKGSMSTGMTSLLYLFYQAGPMNSHTRALVPFVMGAYTPPMEYAKYAKLRPRQQLIYQNTQGANRLVNLYLYKNAKVLLSTAVCFHPFERGYQENIVQAAIDATAQVFINHPGEGEVYGLGRPGFWAGNGSLPRAFQHETLSVVQYRIPPENPLDYTHAYAPLHAFSRRKMGEKSLVLEKDGAYIGLFAMNGLHVQARGPCRDREIISGGRDNVWLVRVATSDEFSTPDALLTVMENTQISAAAWDRLTVTHDGREYAIEDNQLMQNGKPVHHYPLGIQGDIGEEGL